MSEKKWELLAKRESKGKQSSDEVIALLLKNRGLTKKKDIEDFLHPDVDAVTPDSVGIDNKQLDTALKRIHQATNKKERVIIFGDYDVDGICGTAILWETLFVENTNAMPYIPHRVDEGYGLSIKGIDHVLELYPDTSLIITVDNGIVAHKAVLYAKEKNIDVIITDHHVVSDTSPDAHAIVHTIKLCGTGVAYLVSLALKNKNIKKTEENNRHLELVALATIADLVPLLGANRAVTKKGLELLQTTQRIGLIELFKEALLESVSITSYHVGHLIAPRLNAMGRLEYAMESLRLLCTPDVQRAYTLAQKLGATNRERQDITKETVAHAIEHVEKNKLGKEKVLIIADASYQPGVIGLVAGKLVESYYRPSIVLSIGETYAKASARSIAGFNIIDFIRSGAAFLVDAGGHPMAAGFTVEVGKLQLLKAHLFKKAQELVTDELLMRSIKIDTEISFSLITDAFYNELQSFAPFGMGNYEPVFMTKQVTVVEKRLIGKEQNHVKVKVSHDGKTLEGIAFSMAENFSGIKIGDTIDMVYTIDENEWNGKKSLQLKIKDIKIE